MEQAALQVRPTSFCAVVEAGGAWNIWVKLPGSCLGGFKPAWVRMAQAISFVPSRRQGKEDINILVKLPGFLIGRHRRTG